MAIKVLAAATGLKASTSIRMKAYGAVEHTVSTVFRSLAATAISALTIKTQGSLTNEDGVDGPIENPTVAIGSTAENTKTGTFDYLIAGVTYTKTTVTAGVALTAAHEIDDEKWGGFNIYIDTSGATSTKQPGATQTTAQAYTSAALAHTALDGVVKPPGTIRIGRVLISMVAHGGTGWTGKTDNMTNSSDVTTATFTSVTSSFSVLDTHVFTADEITEQRAMWHVDTKSVEYIRHYISTMTGTGEVDTFHKAGFSGKV